MVWFYRRFLRLLIFPVILSIINHNLHHAVKKEKKKQSQFFKKTTKHTRADFLVFETITPTYLFQLALEIMRWRLAI